MKRFTKICLILAAVMVICGIAVCGAGYVGGAVRDLRSPIQSESGNLETIDLSGDQIQKAQFTLRFEDISILPSKDGDLHVEYTPLKNYEYEYDLEEAKKSGIFTFRSMGSDHGFRLFSMNFTFLSDHDDTTIRVYLPKNMYLDASTASGDIVLDQTELTGVGLSTTSGDITVDGLTSGETHVSTTSGEVELTGCLFASLSVSSTSGDMEVQRCTVSGGADFSTTSGEVELEDTSIQGAQAGFGSVSGDISLSRSEIYGCGQFNTTSGEVSLTETMVQEDLDTETVSGDVYLALHYAAPHRAKTSTVSGEISISGADDSAAYGISVSTTSGNITIREEIDGHHSEEITHHEEPSSHH